MLSNIIKLLESFSKATACGPSGMRVKHLIDALSATLPTSLNISTTNSQEREEKGAA